MFWVNSGIITCEYQYSSILKTLKVKLLIIVCQREDYLMIQYVVLVYHIYLVDRSPDVCTITYNDYYPCCCWILVGMRDLKCPSISDQGFSIINITIRQGHVRDQQQCSETECPQLILLTTNSHSKEPIGYSSVVMLYSLLIYILISML